MAAWARHSPWTAVVILLPKLGPRPDFSRACVIASNMPRHGSVSSSRATCAVAEETVMDIWSFEPPAHDFPTHEPPPHHALELPDMHRLFAQQSEMPADAHRLLATFDTDNGWRVLVNDGFDVQ